MKFTGKEMLICRKHKKESMFVCKVCLKEKGFITKEEHRKQLFDMQNNALKVWESSWDKQMELVVKQVRDKFEKLVKENYISKEEHFKLIKLCRENDEIIKNQEVEDLKQKLAEVQNHRQLLSNRLSDEVKQKKNCMKRLADAELEQEIYLKEKDNWMFACGKAEKELQDYKEKVQDAIFLCTIGNSNVVDRLRLLKELEEK